MTDFAKLPPLRRAAAVMDLSGFGRCSLTVALPILSVMGVQTSCLPTAVLSTHTGGFTGYTFRDLTGDMRPFFTHWKKEGFAFDALYVGYLGSVEQIAVVRDFIDTFRGENTLVLVDPVMGDHGRLYSRFTDEMVSGIRALCARADVIVPNMTEAAFLTDTPYKEGKCSAADAREICGRLLALGAKSAVLTGVMPRQGSVGAACLTENGFSLYAPRRVPAQYDGTGDVFASVLLGALMRGKKLPAACRAACDFTRDCVALSTAHHVDMHHGVDFEPLLSRLAKI